VVAPPTSTAGGATGGLTEGFLDEVGAWLVKHQPISLAINGATGDAEHSASTAPAHYHAACRLFERSALCVYSVGDADKPALTAQARPQDGETFGELPPASVMTDVTRFPMLAPAAQAAYWAYHPRAHLAARGADGAAALASYDAADAAAVGALVEAAASPVTKGYLLELADYLRTAATGPKRTHGARTCLYGLQRPPMDGTLTALRCTEITSLDELLPFLLPFALTNAAPQALLSVDPANDGLLDELPRLQLAVPGVAEIEMRIHTERQFGENDVQEGLLRTIRPEALASIHPFPLAQQFVSRLVMAGHAKAARADDAHFLQVFGDSAKWLRFGGG